MSDNKFAFEKPFVESLTRLGENLRHGLSKSRALGCLGPYVYAIGETLLEEGIQVDRVNLPPLSTSDLGIRSTPSRT